ncbi:MAG: hypothetical protein HOY76_01285 [Streptomyces sp.]|nr:hypothetical protein [Streptomyces sp.]
MPAAGFDPAYIPGITAPRPDEPKEAAEPSPEDAVPDEAAVAADDVDAVDDERAESADAAEEDTAEAKAEDGDEEEADGPVFKASDHRGSISAGRRGVTLLLDGETAEFDWSEIGAVEIDTPRFGRRFSVTVYTTARRWYSADIAASSRKALKEWTTELDAVLDTYFEDTKPEDAKAKETKPEDAKAEDTKPDKAEPEKTEPEDAESSDTESEATEPSDAKS